MTSSSEYETRRQFPRAASVTSEWSLAPTDTPREDTTPSRRAVVVRVVIATAISVACVLFFATRIQLAQLTALLRQANAGWLLASAGALGAANLIRAERFRLLDGNRRGLPHWWVATQVYNFVTSTLPGGLGEVATAYLFRRSNAVGWAGAFRLLVIARLLDLAALLGVFVAAIVALGLAWASPDAAAVTAIGGTVMLGALALLIPRTQAAALALLLRFLPQRFPLFAKARETLRQLRETSQTLDRRAGALVALWSVAMALISSSLVLLLLAGFGTHLSLLQSFASYGLYVLLQLIPLQGIAGIGAQSARWAIALTLVGVAAPAATLDSVALYVCLYGMVAAWAIVAGLVGLALRRAT